jgi:hypothetical protein
MQEIPRKIQGLDSLSVDPIYQPVKEKQKNDTAPIEKKWNQMSLRERSQVLSEALGYADTATEEELEIIFDLKEGVEEKLISTGYVCRKFDQAAEIILSEASVLIKQAEALKERSGVFLKRSERIKQRMKEAMSLNNIKRIETPLLTLLLRQKTPKLEMDPQMDIDQFSSDSPFVRIKKDFDKRAILTQLKAGNPIEGFSLSEPEFSLSIKP